MKRQFNARLSDFCIAVIAQEAKRLGSQAAVIEDWATRFSGQPVSGSKDDPIYGGDFKHVAKVPDLGVAPKGSFSKEDLKALIAAKSPALEPILRETPHAPFDVDIEGEPHRVTQSGKRLWLFYLGPVGPVAVRELRQGEMEQLWDKRKP